uniref:Uncharacterized protein n=1 Tax=viral metagenome TaxID=1070528 RepID=A0A6C0BL30_9ZZZZ
MLSILQFLLSFILGWGTGWIMIHLWKPWIIYHGPNSDTVRQQIYADSATGHCFRYEPQTYLCPINVIHK